MPSNSSYHLRPSFMAVVVEDHHHPFKLPPWKRRSRLRSSFPHPNPSLLELDPPSITLKPTPHIFCRSLSTPCLSTPAAAATAASSAKLDDPASTNLVSRIEIVGAYRSRGIQALIVEAAIALAFGAKPVPVSDELNKAYYLHERSGECLAVIKPVDEELIQLGLLNGPGLSTLSVRAGETGVREVAAYLLDHGGFSGVPPTALIKIAGVPPTPHTVQPAKKLASIQRFVPHDFDAGELGPSRFSVSSVHRIGILDVRLLNVDRHAGNILVKKEKNDNFHNDSCIELVPIDHGLCLPELVDDPYFEWLHWPQASVPFSELEVEYIAALDPFRDAELLRTQLPSIRESSLRVLIVCSIFLKRAVSAGLCLADIGDMMTREFSSFVEGPSTLEIVCKQVESSMKNTTAVFSLDYENANLDQSSINSAESTEFQFDMDQEDEEVSNNQMNNVLYIPSLPQRRALEDLIKFGEKNYDGDGREQEHKYLGGLTKSVSCSAADFNGDGRKNMSFEGMSEEEWALFLERFEQVLPQTFEARGSKGLKQRLGTSCSF